MKLTLFPGHRSDPFAVLDATLSAIRTNVARSTPQVPYAPDALLEQYKAINLEGNAAWNAVKTDDPAAVCDGALQMATQAVRLVLLAALVNAQRNAR